MDNLNVNRLQKRRQEYYKFPKIPHLPYSPGVTMDDKRLESDDMFKRKHVVVTLKMDGENTTMYSDHIHARSLDSKDHESRHYVKRIHAQIKSKIPIGCRIVGENLFAKHSIYYRNLPDWFLVTAVFDSKNKCLSWKLTEKWATYYGLKTVPKLFEGIYSRKKIESLYTDKFDDTEMEGFVVRLSKGFHYDLFHKSTAKYVRKGHIQTNGHWLSSKVVVNELRKI